jgi:sec-independent protein translocase protein TatA
LTTMVSAIGHGPAVLAFFSPEGMGLALVLALVLIFGANQLPKMARSIGEASKEFKKTQQEAADEEAAKAQAAPPQAPPAPAPLPPADDRITLSKADLEALLAERDAKARREAEAHREAETPPSA